MKTVLSESFQHKKPEILSLVKNFQKEGTVLKKGRNTIKLFDFNGIKVNVKSFGKPNKLNAFVYGYVRKSKAQRSFQYATRLLKSGIGTPQPIGYLEEKGFLGLGKSYYISEHLNYDLTYRELVEDEEYPDRLKILREFTAFTFLLHENNVLFKDHSPGNTLIKKEGEHYRFFLVDLNRMQFKTLSFEERIKNFSRLTPKKDMVEVMSRTYAALTSSDFQKVFQMMWRETEKFQKRFFRKKRLKRKLGF